MKKTISLILALVLILAMAIPAYAAETASTDAAACLGCGTMNEPDQVNEVGVYQNTTHHKIKTVRSYICDNDNCLEVYRKSTTSAINYAHTSYYVDASCNGTVQTHTKHCTKCNTTYEVEVDCPRAPHTGSCPLPV